MLKFLAKWSLCLLFIANGIAQDVTFSGFVEGQAILNDEVSPFWMFTNSKGFKGAQTNAAFSAFAKANIALNENSTIDIGLGGFARDGFDNSVQRSQIYVEYKNKWIDVVVGAKDFADSKHGLSSTNGNILFSNNARALPGLLIQNAKPIRLFKGFSFDAAIAHYQLNDDRFVDDTRVHYKKLLFNWDITNTSVLRFGLQHVAQWGGVSPDRGAQPDGFDDFIQIFFGRGGGEEAFIGDQINSLGNHIGSYSISFSKKKESFDYEVYYQSIFEDRSGIELNNFPDGVWGLLIHPKKVSWLEGVLYEYVQTVSQSGSPRVTEGLNQQSGGDNYFSNTTYRSGWTYDGAIIGLPFINLISNRSIAHHIGAFGDAGKLNYLFKISYLENLGSFALPIEPRDRLVFTYTRWQLPTEKYGVFSLDVGADFSDGDTQFGAGLGYKYQFK